MTPVSGAILFRMDRTAGTAGEEVLERAPAVLWRRTLRGVLISVVGEEEPFLLTAPGDAMWAMIDRPMTRTELVDLLAASFDAPARTIAGDVEPVLQILVDRGALVSRRAT